MDVARWRPGWMVLRQQEARGVGRKLTDGDATNVAIRPEFREAIDHPIIEREPAALHREGQERCFEYLAERAEIEEAVAGYRPLGGGVGPSVVEEQGPSLEPQGDCRAAYPIVGPPALDVPRDDALHLVLRLWRGDDRTSAQHEDQRSRQQSHDRLPAPLRGLLHETRHLLHDQFAIRADAHAQLVRRPVLADLTI